MRNSILRNGARLPIGSIPIGQWQGCLCDHPYDLTAVTEVCSPAMKVGYRWPSCQAFGKMGVYGPMKSPHRFGLLFCCPSCPALLYCIQEPKYSVSYARGYST